MNQSKQQFDVLVVGAGLIGAAFALRLAKRTDLQIALIERAAAITANEYPNQRVVALGQAATDLLTEVGVRDSLGIESCYPYDKMFVWDEHSDGELSFSAADYAKQTLGHLVDSQQCNWQLQQAIGFCNNISTFYEFQAQSLELGADGVSIHTSELCLQAPLVVGADGSRSWVRQQAKIFASGHDYQQRGIVAKISTELNHQDTAWQRFLSTGPLAVLPLAENQSSIVWSADNQRAEELLALSPEELQQAIAQALEYRLGDVSLLSKVVAFPLQSQQAEVYFKRGVVLIGDAAHSIHPLAGQGANLGFKDATALTAVLQQQLAAPRGKTELGELSVLQRFQRARRLDNQQTDLLMSTLHQVFKNDSPWFLSARGAGMNWLSSSVSLKELLVKQAMGI